MEVRGKASSYPPPEKRWKGRVCVRALKSYKLTSSIYPWPIHTQQSLPLPSPKNMTRMIFLFLVSMFLHIQGQEVPFSERLFEEKKCQMLCKMMQLEHQCGHCNSRMPIRFGKRSQEIEVNLHTFLNAQQTSENDYLMQALMKRFFPPESKMFNLHLKY